MTIEEKTKIDSWLRGIKETESLQKIWRVVKAIQNERELGGNDTLHIPIRRLPELRDEDLEAIITKLAYLEIIIAGTDSEDVTNNPSLAAKPGSWLAIYSDKFDYLFDKLRSSNLDQPKAKVAITPHDWELSESNNKAFLIHKDKTVFTFKNSWSKRYKYFKCLWDNFGQHVSFETLYNASEESTYPGNTKTYKTNDHIRRTINKLKTEIKELPFTIETSKGFTLTLNRP